MEAQEKKVARFDCTCYGCRGILVKPSQIWHKDQVRTMERETHYFSKETMRFFSSRIVDFRPVIVSRPDVAWLSVLVSSRYGYEGASRYYEIVYLCPYGHAVRDTEVQYESVRQARKAWDNLPAPVCKCHGCTLDKEGRA